MPEQPTGDPSEELRQFYPGYSGYEEKRLRSFTDSTVRSELATILNAGQKKLNKLILDLVREQRHSEVMALSELCQRLDQVCSHLRFESQNGWRFFQAGVLPGSLLEKLRQKDLALAHTCQGVTRRLLLPNKSNRLEKQCKRANDEVQEIERLLEDRQRLIAAVDEPE